MPTAETPGGVCDDRVAMDQLRALGVDVPQLAVQPLPPGLWALIADIVVRVRWKKRRWYAAACSYRRLLGIVHAGGTVADLPEQFGAGAALAPLLAHAELRETVLAARLPGSLNRWLGEVVRRTKLHRSEILDVAGQLIVQIQQEVSA